MGNGKGMFCISLWAFSLGAQALPVEKPNLRTVATLHRTEEGRAVLVNDGLLYVGHSQKEGPQDRKVRKNWPRLSEKKAPPTYYHRLEIYPLGATQPAEEIELAHSPTYIYALDAHTVLVLGKSQWPMRTEFTKVWRQGGKFHTATTSFKPLDDSHEDEEEAEDDDTPNQEMFVNEFAGTSELKFFTEFGARSVWFKRGVQDPAILPPSAVSAVTSAVENIALAPVLSGDSLYFVERRGVLDVDHDRVARLNWRTGELVRVPKTENSRLLSHSTAWENGAAFSEAKAGRVLLVDRSDVARPVQVGGSPRGLARWGHCVGVVDEFSKEIHFIDTRRKSAPVVAIWDLKGAGASLGRPTEIGFSSEAAYVRSNYSCSSCFPSQNSVVEAKLPGGVAERACR